MSARQLRVQRHVEASPDQVWEVLTDLPHAAETLRGVTRVEVLEKPDYEVGTRWVETRRMFGKEESQELLVTEVEEPRRTVVQARARGVDYRTEFRLDESDGGTDLAVTFGASHPDPTLLHRITATVFGTVGAAVTKRLLAQDLDDIAQRAERADRS